MTKSILIRNARIVNENTTFKGDVLIENEIIKKVGSSIEITNNKSIEIIEADGSYLIPGFKFR